MGLFSKLRKGLKKTRDEGLTAQVDEVIETYDEICDELFEELEEVLIMGDVGLPTAERVINDLKEKIENDKITDVSEVRSTLKDIVAGVVWGGSYLKLRTKPSIILVIGVNGVGKTTAIGKLANYYKNQKKSVVMAAGDTFRAAASDQLTIWADRAKVRIVKQAEGADSASVVFDAVTSAKAKKDDVLLIDTAGRLHNKVNLMEELKKISKVVTNQWPDCQYKKYIVLDATTGQNAIPQVEYFNEAVGLDGIILTKLDGTSKGGVVIEIVNKLKIPVVFVGVGEGIDDLLPFNTEEFVDAII